MARLTLILGVLATVVYLLDGFRFMLNEWRTWRNKSKWLVVVGLVCMPTQVMAEDFYLAMTDTGGATRADCANAGVYTWFNTAANWGGGAGEIDPGDTVHLCGEFTGGAATNFLIFQSSGTAGNYITVKFETGAIMKPNYCAYDEFGSTPSGCIDVNGKDYLVIDGGTACGNSGSASGWVTTSCNGQILNLTAGSSTMNCPSGSACTDAITHSAAISTVVGAGSPQHIEVKNMKLGPICTRDPTSTTAECQQTIGFGWSSAHGEDTALDITLHHSICDYVARCYLVSIATLTQHVSGYSVHHTTFTNQCWAMGVGGDGGNSWDISSLSFYDNKVSDWAAYAKYGTTCHTNGTMWFNGDEFSIHTGNGFIGTSDSMMYNNLLVGDMSGGFVASSASGFLSCQDNCTDIYVFNNVIDVICSGSNGEFCGGPLYYNGPGGGGQHVFNNTVISSVRNVYSVTVSGVTANTISKNNIFSGNQLPYNVRPNDATAVTSDFNDTYNVTDTSTWYIYNTAVGLSIKTLAQFRADGQDVNTITSNPLLSSSYRLGVGSPSIGLAENLTSLGIAALNVDAAGNSRPAVGNWDAGAYQYAETVSSPVVIGRVVRWMELFLPLASYGAYAQALNTVRLASPGAILSHYIRLTAYRMIVLTVFYPLAFVMHRKVGQLR